MNKIDTDEMIKQYTATIDDPNASDTEKAPAHFGRGLAYRKSGKYDNAIKDYDTAIRLEPSEAKTHYFRGIAKKNLSDPKEVVATKQEDVNTFFTQGVSNAALGDDKKAIDDFNKTIKLKPEYTEAYDARVILNLKNQDTENKNQSIENAIDDLNKAL